MAIRYGQFSQQRDVNRIVYNNNEVKTVVKDGSVMWEKPFTLNINITNPSYIQSYSVRRVDAFEPSAETWVDLEDGDTIYNEDRIDISATAKATEYGEWDIDITTSPLVLVTSPSPREIKISNKENYQIRAYWSKTSGTKGSYTIIDAKKSATVVVDSGTKYYIIAEATRTRNKYEYSVQYDSDIIVDSDTDINIVGSVNTTQETETIESVEYTITTKHQYNLSISCNDSVQLYIKKTTEGEYKTYNYPTGSGTLYNLEEGSYNWYIMSLGANSYPKGKMISTSGFSTTTLNLNRNKTITFYFGWAASRGSAGLTGNNATINLLSISGGTNGVFFGIISDFSIYNGTTWNNCQVLSKLDISDGTSYTLISDSDWDAKEERKMSSHQSVPLQISLQANQTATMWWRGNKGSNLFNPTWSSMYSNAFDYYIASFPTVTNDD